MESTTWNLDAAEIEVSIKRGGKEENLVLREMSAALRDKYLDEMAARVRLSSDGTPQGIKKFEGLQADLLRKCLFRDGKPVEPEEIQKWPSSVVAKLFAKAQEINGLGKAVETAPVEAKNV